MSQTVTQDDERAGRAIEAALGVTVALPFVGLVVMERDILVAALIFNNFDRVNVDLSITVCEPLKIGAVRDIAKYVFCKLGVRRVSCVTHSSNHPAIKSLLRLGFEFEGTMRDRFADGDGLLFGLLASRQRFVRLNESAAGSRSLRDSSGANRQQ